ncbi:MAG: hypothetical protein OJF60_000538 [Burkholderiaceae bacterium]|jgi:hypothetical protein|nr:MAG: hypothetical protein OJF60_000538 [Burkholderiaceae bacterium]
MTNQFKYVGISLILASLAACGGGGGDAASSPATGSATADRMRLSGNNWWSPTSWWNPSPTSSSGTSTGGGSSGGTGSTPPSGGSSGGSGSTPPSGGSSGSTGSTPPSGGSSGGTGSTPPSGGSSGGTPTANSKSFPQTCLSKGGKDTYYKYGNYTVSSNIWNPGAASSYTQCTSATIRSPGSVDAEFDWNFSPSSSSGNVLTYPNIQYGQQTLYSPTTTPALPAPISSLPSLIATGSITTTCQSSPCYYDSGFDIFFSKGTPPPAATQGELMIITSWNFSQTLGGFAATNVNIDGVLYNIRQFTMGSGANSWPYVAYYPTQQPITNMQLNIASFVKDAVARGYIPGNYYLDMVELGTEVIQGQGKTVITNFQVQ